jgi:acetaldehyde dehydrogenase
MNVERSLSVGILGAGLIGVDLAVKADRASVLDLRMIAGRDAESPGLKQAARLGLPTGCQGIRSIVELDEPLDLVFDATNAAFHSEHAEALAPFGTVLVDLTPSRVGHMILPTVNRSDILSHRDISMVSCGAQASVPIARAIAQAHPVDYIEVVATAATLSVGRGTRLNLDEYVETTQDALREFTGVSNVKAMLNVSPARPPAAFRVAVSVLGEGLTDASVSALVAAAATNIRAFTPGFAVTVCTVNDGMAFVAVEVISAGDRIPAYAGNLDIINFAAMQVAEHYAIARQSVEAVEAS